MDGGTGSFGFKAADFAAVANLVVVQEWEVPDFSEKSGLAV